MSDTAPRDLSLEAILTRGDLIGIVRRDLAVTLVNISRTGCLLESSSPVEDGAIVMLHLDAGGRHFNDPVRVARCRAVPGAGDRFHLAAEFVWLDAPGERSLRRFASMLPHLKPVT